MIMKSYYRGVEDMDIQWVIDKADELNNKFWDIITNIREKYIILILLWSLMLSVVIVLLIMEETETEIEIESEPLLKSYVLLIKKQCPTLDEILPRIVAQYYNYGGHSGIPLSPIYYNMIQLCNMTKDEIEPIIIDTKCVIQLLNLGQSVEQLKRKDCYLINCKMDLTQNDLKTTNNYLHYLSMKDGLLSN